MYAKIENGNLIFSPRDIIFDGKRVVNPSEDMLKTLGYKPYVSTPYPQDDLHYKQSYVKTDNEITLVWVNDEVNYWKNIPYEEAVNIEIRKRYSETQEFAILREEGSQIFKF